MFRNRERMPFRCRAIDFPAPEGTFPGEECLLGKVPFPQEQGTTVSCVIFSLANNQATGQDGRSESASLPGR